MTDPDRTTLKIDGQLHEGWKEVEIVRSLEAISATFSLTMTERWPGQDSGRAVMPGDACELAIGGEVIVTGFVDQVSPSFDAKDHTIKVTGRDRSGDLVDCSAIDEPGEWHGRSMSQVVGAIARPFGVAVRLAAGKDATLRRFKLQPGESAFEAIRRACAMNTMLPVPDGLGGVVLTRAGDARVGVALVEGANLLSGEAAYNDQERFSRYIVKAQQAGDDDIDPDSAAHVRAEATDDGIRRFRPLIIIAEDQADAAASKDRAVWERNTRRGKSRQITAVTDGWRAGSTLWPLNALVPVKSPKLYCDRDMLIASVRYQLNAQGKLTTLGLVWPEAYEVLVPVEKDDDGDLSSVPLFS